MSKTVMTVLILGTLSLLLLAGCNKTGKKKEIDTSKIEEAAPNLAAVPEAQERDVSDEEAARQRDEQRAQDLRTELIDMMPEFSFTYNEAQDTMEGADLKSPVSVATMVSKLEDRVLQLQNNPGKAEYQQLIRVMLTQFKTAGMQAPDSSEEQSGNELASKPSDDKSDSEVNDYGLKKAPKVFGEWRSLREEGPKFLIEHNEDYYKQLLVYYGRNCIYSTFSKGQRIKNDEFNYKYDKGAGELLLTAADGRYNMTFECFVRDSEPGLLYVKQPSGTAYTVYEKIGRGEEPPTEEEKQAFLDLQKEISGGGGGSAKEGAE